MAFITTLPIWVCCLVFSLPALIAWLAFGTKIGLFGVIIWFVYGIIITDFLPPISRSGMTYYQMPPSPAPQHIRVLTLYENCEEDPALQQISELHSDVIFIQGCSNQDRTLTLARNLFGRTANVAQIGNCAIIVRDGQIGPTHSITDTSGVIVDWIPENANLAIRLININLETFENRFDWYNPTCWKYFHTLRVIHRKQLQYLFDTVREIGTQYGTLPIILAGNFSEPPQSPIFTKLNSDFKDCFKLRGEGYGATHPTYFPMLRLDRIFCMHPLKPERATTMSIPNAIRRAVLTDIALP